MTCAGCGTPLPPRRKKWCSNTCHVRAWRAQNRDRYRAMQHRNYHANPEKSEARYQVKLALIYGRITKPEACSSCGETKPLDAHHANGYDEAHWLDVTWLCKACHGLAHRKPKVMVKPDPVRRRVLREVQRGMTTAIASLAFVPLPTRQQDISR